MPTDLMVAKTRMAEAKRNNDVDVTIAWVWLVLYLVMLVGTLAEPAIARALEFAALY